MVLESFGHSVRCTHISNKWGAFVKEDKRKNKKAIRQEINRAAKPEPAPLSERDGRGIGIATELACRM